jgi:ribose transport system substrate-binding protein
MLRALEEDGRAGQVRFVGFDANEKLIEALGSGKIQGLILQNPFQMGYLGVKVVSSAILKQPYEAKVDTGVVLVTPENMNDPEIHAVMVPDLSQYLSE